MCLRLHLLVRPVREHPLPIHRTHHLRLPTTRAITMVIGMLTISATTTISRPTQETLTFMPAPIAANTQRSTSPPKKGTATSSIAYWTTAPILITLPDISAAARRRIQSGTSSRIWRPDAGFPTPTPGRRCMWPYVVLKSKRPSFSFRAVQMS
ncbi:hypothetical protein VTK56DRAFT_2224 [Thermocarpiscus australiensis]